MCNPNEILVHPNGMGLTTSAAVSKRFESKGGGRTEEARAVIAHSTTEVFANLVKSFEDSTRGADSSMNRTPNPIEGYVLNFYLNWNSKGHLSFAVLQTTPELVLLPRTWVYKL